MTGGTIRESRRDRTDAALRQRQTALSEAGRRATLGGEFHAALSRYRAARAYAARIGDVGLADAAELNVAMVRVQLGQSRRAEDGLREILLRTDEDRIAFHAAYYLASALRRQARLDKAMTYATRALDRAHAMGLDESIAAAEMLVGNILLAQSYAERALAAYRRALDIRERQPGDQRYSLAILHENIGYCRLQLGQFDDGIRAIERALELAEDVGDRRCQAECRQDLCYGFLLQDRLEDACGHGEAALVLAREFRYEDIEENCHYLLGEIHGRAGAFEARDGHFQRLQDLHPELPFLRDFLCAVDVTSIITLKR